MWLPPLVAVIGVRLAATTCPSHLHSADEAVPCRQRVLVRPRGSGIGAALPASAFIVARLVGPAEVGIGAAGDCTRTCCCGSRSTRCSPTHLVQRGIVEDDTFSSAFVTSTIAIGCRSLRCCKRRSAGLWRGRWRTTDWVVMSLVLALPLPPSSAQRDRCRACSPAIAPIGRWHGARSSAMGLEYMGDGRPQCPRRCRRMGIGAPAGGHLGRQALLTLLLWCPLPPHRQLEHATPPGAAADRLPLTREHSRAFARPLPPGLSPC